MTDLTETRRLQKRVAHMQRLSALVKWLLRLLIRSERRCQPPCFMPQTWVQSVYQKASRGNFHTKLMSRLKDLETQVNDMLLFAKSGEQQVVESVSMQQLLNEVKAGADAMVAQNQSTLAVNLPEPDIEIVGNKTALGSAIQNLIHNSIQIIGKHAEVIAEC